MTQDLSLIYHQDSSVYIDGLRRKILFLKVKAFYGTRTKT